MLSRYVYAISKFNSSSMFIIDADKIIIDYSQNKRNFSTLHGSIEFEKN